MLRPLARALPVQQSWTEWLRERLPAELAAHVIGALPKPPPPQARSANPAGGQLLVLADSGAWCTRLRYALGGLQDEVRARDGALGRINVRVGRG